MKNETQQLLMDEIHPCAALRPGSKNCNVFIHQGVSPGAPGQYNLDGNHRAEQARRMSITGVQANRLDDEQHIRFPTGKKGL
ncbi:MAG: hypothetical protein SCH71_17190 [Desulfobulbaceae bacterium]|nr:hypothetical protein [Desulfobulbaceae bacterium]